MLLGSSAHGQAALTLRQGAAQQAARGEAKGKAKAPEVGVQDRVRHLTRRDSLSKDMHCWPQGEQAGVKKG